MKRLLILAILLGLCSPSNAQEHAESRADDGFKAKIRLDKLISEKIADGYWIVGFNGYMNGCVVATKYTNRSGGPASEMWIGKSVFNGEVYTYLAFTSEDKNYHSTVPGRRYQMSFNFILSKKNAKLAGVPEDVDYKPAYVFLGTHEDSLAHGFYLLVKDRKLLELIAFSKRFAVFWKNPNTGKGKVIIGPYTLNKSMKAIEELSKCHGETYERALEFDKKAMAEVRAAESKESPPEMTQDGTGFFVSERGHILTSFHVLGGCAYNKLTAKYQGSDYKVSIVKEDQENDLALLYSTIKPIKHAMFERLISLGEAAHTFGYPLSNILSKSGSFTSGRVTSMAGVPPNTFQISTPIQPGNSGGAVLNGRGAVIGVVSSRLSQKATNSVAGYSFAVKAATATEFIKSDVFPRYSPTMAMNKKPTDIAKIGQDLSVHLECSP